MAIRVSQQELNVGYLPTPLDSVLVTQQELNVGYLPTPLNSVLTTQQELNVGYLPSYSYTEERYAKTSSQININQTITFGCWINTAYTDIEQCAISISTDELPQNYYSLSIIPGGGVVLKRANQYVLRSIFAPTVYSYGSWTNITGVINLKNSLVGKVCIGGRSSNYETYGLYPDKFTSITVGRLSKQNPEQYFGGQVAHVYIYNTAIPDWAITLLGTGFSPLSSNLTTVYRYLYAYYPLTPSTQTIDVVGGNNLRSYGFTTSSRAIYLKEDPISRLQAAGEPTLSNTLFSPLVQDKVARVSRTAQSFIKYYYGQLLDK